MSKSLSFEQIQTRLQDSQPPQVDHSEALRCAQLIRQNSDRLLFVRALMCWATGKNEGSERVSPAQFTELGLCNGWPQFAKMPSDDTLRNFVGGKRPQNPDTLAAYLYGLAVLKRYGFVGFANPIGRTLVRHCEPLTTFERSIHVATAGSTTSFDEAVRTGRALYDMLSRGSARIISAQFETILRSEALVGIREAKDDKQLDEYQVHLNSVRMGASGERYVVTKLSVAMLNASLDPLQPEYFLYIRMWMKSDQEIRPAIRSHGFIIPRDKHYYLMQYHLEGQGFNVAAIANSDLLNKAAKFYRGIALAVDREGEIGVLGAPIALFRANRPNLLIGNWRRSELNNKMQADGFGGDLLRISDYLRNSNRVALSPLGAEPGALGSRSLARWSELKDYISRPEIAEKIDILDHDEDDIIGNHLRPLRSI